MNSDSTIHCILVCSTLPGSLHAPAYHSLSAPTTDDAIRELVLNQPESLQAAGFDRAWLDEYGMKEWGVGDCPSFQNETRWFRWWGVFSQYESDDVIVDGYFVDFFEIEEDWCCLFVNACNEVWIGYVNAMDETKVFQALQNCDLSEYGFEFESEDCNNAFSVDWVLHSLHQYTEKKVINQWVSEFFWDRTSEFDEWGELRCFVIKRA